MSPAPQMNLRLRDGLDVQLRVRAAQDGVDARELVENALIATYGFNRSGGAPTPRQTAITIEEAAESMREEITFRQQLEPSPSSRAEGWQANPIHQEIHRQIEEAVKPMREAIRQVEQTKPPDLMAALEKSLNVPAAPTGGCPECGGELLKAGGAATCTECGWKGERP